MDISEPIKIGTVEIKNRITMAAMDVGYANHGFVTDQLVAFYKERAAGGVGLIIVGGCYTEKLGMMWKGMLGLEADKFIPGLRRLADVIHEEGAKVGAQLLHGGGCCHSFFIRGQPVSASSVRCLNKRMAAIPRALTLEEITQTIGNFAQAACRAREAGFDSVELIASMGYLISQFLSPLTNQRQDRYGGDLHGRMTFLLELIAAIKEKTGRDFPIIVKISGDELMPGGHKLKENLEIAMAIERAGADAIAVAPGRHDSPVSVMSMYIPQGAFLFLPEKIKKVVHIPVIAGNRLASLRMIKSPVQNGQADMVSLGRPLIADPELPHKILKGDYGRIRWCLSCNQGCFDSVVSFKPVRCTINARAGREKESEAKKAARPKKVMIIGGGPAGMEAARVCALRGHKVRLYEKTERLGGQAFYASLPWGKRELRNIIEFLETELQRSKVEVLLHREADVTTVQQEKPEVVVIATGARPVVPGIKGIDNPRVLPAIEVLSGLKEVGERVVIIGGGSVGCQTAIHLAKMGRILPRNAIFLMESGIVGPEQGLRETIRGNREITILEEREVIGSGIGKSNRWIVFDLLKKCGVNLVRGVKVEEIRLHQENAAENGVVIAKSGSRELLRADTVVVAAGSRPDRSLYDRLAELNEWTLCLIGDAREPRYILNAIHEGFEAGCRI
jgi:2,4-dienoyl-CoA reductase (NADPH2)